MKSILKKIILPIFILFFLGISNIWSIYAEWDKDGNSTSNSTSSSDWIKIIVTEKVPWANCHKIDEKWEPWVAKEWETQLYECLVAKWFTSVTIMLWKMIKYFTFIAWLWWVLFIIINGILYSMWWSDQSMSDEAKKRIVWTLKWLAILFLSWVILNLIAPWIYK